MRVLVVDDDADVAVMITRIVTHLGHQAKACANATEAIQEAAFCRFDVVLADFMMVPDGIAVLSSFVGCSTYRILLTASYATVEIRDAMLNNVVHVLLPKPATIRELRAAINASLDDPRMW